MSQFTNAMDTYTSENSSTQLGTNNHSEYKWSGNTTEQIVQLFYQINRCNDTSAKALSEKFYTIASDMRNDEYFTDILARLIMYTRDIIDGKGERQISFDFVYEFARIHPEKAKQIIEYFVRANPNNSNEKQHPYGSWRDLKLLWSYYDWKSIEFDSDFMVKLINDQLRQDVSSSTPSLVAKWIPREKSKYAVMFMKLAEDYFGNYLSSVTTLEQKRLACSKAYTHYRKIISLLNKQLDTVQIKQCARTYADINYKNVTSITMAKQKNAFLNILPTGKQRSIAEDRIEGANNLKAFVSHQKSIGKTIQGARVSVYDFIKDATKYIHNDSEELSVQKQILNSQWEDAGKCLHALDNYIAMVDTSGSMTIDNNTPLFNSIGLGCRIAEKSKLGRRVLTFSTTPSWINLEDDVTLTDMVKKMVDDNSSCMGTNFMAALQLILKGIESAKLTNTVVSEMALVILSDMQIDSPSNKPMTSSMWDLINTEYAEAGIRVHGIPYDVPNIVFWNLSTTTGFPTLVNNPGSIMMSGSNIAMINSFCSSGLSELRKMSPFDNVIRLLSADRYKM